MCVENGQMDYLMETSGRYGSVLTKNVGGKMGFTMHNLFHLPSIGGMRNTPRDTLAFFLCHLTVSQHWYPPVPPDLVRSQVV